MFKSWHSNEGDVLLISLDALVEYQHHFVPKHKIMAGENRPPETLLEMLRKKLIETFHVSFYAHSTRVVLDCMFFMSSLDSVGVPKEHYKSLSNKLPKPSGCK